MSVKLSYDLGLPDIPPTQDDRLLVQLNYVYNAIKILASVVDAYTGNRPVDPSDYPNTPPNASIKTQNLARAYYQAGEPIPAGAVVTFLASGGTTKMFVANGAAAVKRAAIAYCAETTAVATGSYGQVILAGLNGFYSGLTPGQILYLAPNNSGILSNTIPTAGSGNLIQPVGFAITDKLLYMNFSPYVGTA